MRATSTRPRFQLIKIVDDKDLGFDPVCWCGYTASERAQDNLLSGVRCLSGKLNERCCLYAAHPMGNHDFLKLDVAAECLQFGGDMLQLFCLSDPLKRGPMLLARCATCR